MTATAVRHRPRIQRRQEETPEGLAWCYRLTCSCGTEFEAHFVKRGAVADRRAHLVEVAAPPERRCRQTTSHHCKSWDDCPLCADQPPLFDL